MKARTHATRGRARRQNRNTRTVTTAPPAGRLWTVDALVGRMKTEIIADMRAGLVPREVDSYSRLHDFTDANKYGGCFDPDCPYDAGDDKDAATINDAQTAVDLWLFAGRVDDIRIEARVAWILRERGHRASYEFPGYVHIGDEDGQHYYATGTANESWDVARHDLDGHAEGIGDTYVLSSCPDAEFIADRVEAVLTKAGARTIK